MTRWEYKIFRRGSTESDHDWLARLNDEGARGWEAFLAMASGLLLRRGTIAGGAS